MPTNIAIALLRPRAGSNGGARRSTAVPAYMFAMSVCATVLERGGPGWLNVLVTLFFWNAAKFTWMVLFSAIALAASVPARMSRTSESGSTLRREDRVSEAPPDGVHQSKRVKTVLVTDGPEGLGHLQGHEGLSRSFRAGASGPAGQRDLIRTWIDRLDRRRVPFQL